MAPAELQSTRYEVSDTVEAIEFYYAKGWTDGLPVVPPTEQSIRSMLDAVQKASPQRSAVHRGRRCDQGGEQYEQNTGI
jgi:hypothetical protein